MADDKTEQPTPKKLQDARKKGQVFKSTDMTQAALFITAAGVLSFSGTVIFERMREFMIESFDPRLLSARPDGSALALRMGNAFAIFLLLVLPLLAGLAIVSVVVNFAQMGGLIFAPEALSPKFEKLNPITGFQNLLFKARPYLELVKNIVKFIVIGWVAYSTLREALPDLVLSSRIGLEQVSAFLPKLFFQLLFKVGGTFLLVGAADFALEKKLYMKQLMMSKEEVKKEFKEQEGDPEIKGHRRHLHMELLKEHAVKQVPKADVVVVNPTHLAVALKYDEAVMNAPQVVAKGELFLAARIRRIAEESGVPVLQDVQLARNLYILDIDEEIPEDLYAAVAEILKLASRLSERNGN